MCSVCKAFRAACHISTSVIMTEKALIIWQKVFALVIENEGVAHVTFSKGLNMLIYSFWYVKYFQKSYFPTCNFTA